MSALLHIFCSSCLHRSLMEDVEMQEMQILKEEKELQDKKEVIELKEVCGCV